MQNRKKLYGTIYISLLLVGLVLFLQNRKSISNNIPISNIPVEVPKVEDPESVVTQIAQPTTEGAWGAKTSMLVSLLNAGNDNDPRYDSDLKNLSEDEKTEFRKLYRTLKMEKRNQRGTIVFLLGRNIHTRDDLDFFREVLSEPKCASLTDCKDTKDQSRELSLIYPQIVSLRVLQAFMLSGTENLKTEVKSILYFASRDRDMRIANLAKSIASDKSK